MAVKKHQHHDLIVQWAATGCKIEYYSKREQAWRGAGSKPRWLPDRQYRIKQAAHEYTPLTRELGLWLLSLG